MDSIYSILKCTIIIFCLVSLIINVTTCPLACNCKWKGGKRKVECGNKNLTIILPDIDTETQVLDYSKNRLRQLAEKVFEKVNLTNLQKLYISECQITQIHDSAFRGLSNLIELDLANNALTSMPNKTFQDFPLLMKLILSGNPIRTIKTDAFVPLKYITNLDLSNCQIDNIEINAFSGLQKLEWLKLDRNNLKNMKYSHTIPHISAGISLHRNPWKCDCHLRNFQHWLINSNEPIISSPVCSEPFMYRDIPIYQIKTEDLACAPYVIPSSLFVEINEGKNISFVCQVNAVPEAVITWDFDGNPVSSNSSIVYPFYKYYAEDATTEQVSELFVFDAKKENNGTYRCTAENKAGKSMSNYTLKVVSIQKSIAQPPVATYFYILISSVATVLVIIFITLILSCVICLKKHSKTVKQRQPQPKEKTKTDIEYEIIKQNNENMVSKTDKNPDLIINAENNLKDNMENCEHLLLLPSDIKQTYLTLSGNTLMNTTIYETKALCAHNDESRISNLPANYSVIPNGGTIKLYLSPNSAKKFQNLYVNPFDGYVDSFEQNYWAIQLPSSENEKLADSSQVVIDCCDKTVCEPSPSNTDQYINLRHNLEGYPYPSKLKLSSLKNCDENNELENTPILSPPDPFKTETDFNVV